MNNERSANSILSLALCASLTKMLKLTNEYISLFCILFRSELQLLYLSNIIYLFIYLDWY